MKRLGAERGEKTEAEFELHLSGGSQVGKKVQHPVEGPRSWNSRRDDYLLTAWPEYSRYLLCVWMRAGRLLSCPFLFVIEEGEGR